MKVPVSNFSGPAFRPPTRRGPGRIESLERSATAMLRKVVGGAAAASGMSSAIWNVYQADFVLPSSTRQLIPTSRLSPVNSRTTRPAAFKP